jgi:hypothetical protein
MHNQASLVVYVRRTPTVNAQIDQLLRVRGHQSELPRLIKLPRHASTGSNGDGFKILLAGAGEILHKNMIEWNNLETDIKKHKTKTKSRGNNNTRTNLLRLQGKHEELWGELRRSALVYLEHYANANRDDDNPDVIVVPEQRFLRPIIRALGGGSNAKTLPSESEYKPIFEEDDDANDADYEPSENDETKDDENDDNDDDGDDYDNDDGAGEEDEDIDEDEDEDEDEDLYKGDVANDVKNASLAVDASDEDKQRAKDEGTKVLESIKTTVARLCNDGKFDVTSAEMDEPAMDKVVKAYSTSDTQSAGNEQRIIFIYCTRLCYNG